MIVRLSSMYAPVYLQSAANVPIIRSGDEFCLQIVQIVADRHGYGYVVRHQIVDHHREKIIGGSRAYFQHVVLQGLLHVVEKRRLVVRETHNEISALDQPDLCDSVAFEDSGNEKIEFVVLFYLTRVVDVQDVLYDEEVDAEMGTERVDALRVFQPVNPYPQFGRRVCLRYFIGKIVAHRFMNRFAGVGDEVYMGFRAALAIVDQLFGQQVVFHAILLLSCKDRALVPLDRQFIENFHQPFI